MGFFVQDGCPTPLFLVRFPNQLSNRLLASYALLLGTSLRRFHGQFSMNYSHHISSVVMSRQIRTLLLVEPHEMTRELYVRELQRKWRVLACADRSTRYVRCTARRSTGLVLEPFAPGDDDWTLLEMLRTSDATERFRSLSVALSTSGDEASNWASRSFSSSRFRLGSLADQVRTVVAAQTSPASQSEL